MCTALVMRMCEYFISCFTDHNMLSVSDQRTPVSHVRRPRDAGQHEKDIGSIIKSEMERFFKVYSSMFYSNN